MFSRDVLQLSSKHPVGILAYRGDVEKLIPGVVRTTLQGENVLIVPHNLDSVRVLRNVGVKAQSPILTRYGWANNTPFKAQMLTAALFSEHAGAFALNEMATGKTRSALFAFDFLREQGRARTMLVVAPLSTLKFTWLAEIQRHLPHLRAEVLRGSAQDVTDKMKAWRADIGIINHDGVRHRLDALQMRAWDVVVVDELTAFANWTASRTKAMAKLARMARYRWGMTGTPIPQGALQAYGQIKLIQPDNMNMPFMRWQDMVTEKVSTFKRVPRAGAKAEVFARMKPAVRFKRSDVVELPPLLPPLWRNAAMSDEQTKAYKAMLSKMKIEFAGGGITAANEGVKLGKLLQIAAGFVYGTDGTTVVLNPRDRIETILQTIEEATAKFIVFSPFVAGVHILGQALAKAGYNAPIVYGATSEKERERVFNGLMDDPRQDGIVAHPRTMSHGLSLVAADLIAWASPPPSLETYLQANARIVRPGQKNPQMIAHITSTPLESRVYTRLQANETTQNLLLEMFSS